jgi:hypothetical protein
MRPDFSLALEDVPLLLDFLARRGCHGALLLGTTGEGPSLSAQERLALLHAALPVRQSWPDFRLLAGTGTPSLEETVALTRQAFDLGLDGVVVLPPYYYRKVSDEGLLAWYGQVLRRGAPQDGAVFGYHIPGVTGVPLSLDLLAQLKDSFPGQFGHRFAVQPGAGKFRLGVHYRPGQFALARSAPGLAGSPAGRRFCPPGGRRRGAAQAERRARSDGSLPAQSIVVQGLACPAARLAPLGGAPAAAADFCRTRSAGLG